MTWKAIGQSIAGTSHIATSRLCDDALKYGVLNDNNGNEILVCFASDGAGSAQYAAYAATYAVNTAYEFVRLLIENNETPTDNDIYAIAEDIYDGLLRKATDNEIELSEFSCTFLGCIITPANAIFFQIGDGAIVRSDDTGNYSVIWWPQNGEYHNTTSFLIDDRNFAGLQVMSTEDRVSEVGIFTDGLQQLVLNTETRAVHAPFFAGLFPHLRQANDTDKINLLNKKLAEYLNSSQINERTDDDKTLFLATRLGQ